MLELDGRKVEVIGRVGCRCSEGVGRDVLVFGTVSGEGDGRVEDDGDLGDVYSLECLRRK